MKHKKFDTSAFYDPYIDWAFMVGCSALVTVVLVSIGLLAWRGAERDISAPSMVDLTAGRAPIDRQALDATISAYQGRADARASITKSYHGPTDPSL